MTIRGERGVCRGKARALGKLSLDRRIIKALGSIAKIMPIFLATTIPQFRVSGTRAKRELAPHTSPKRQRG
jgi:hypothetical protein